MIRLEYEGVEVSIPENWDDITLGHYETFHMDEHKTARERVALVAKICKTDVDLLLNWPAEVFNRIVDYLWFLFEDVTSVPCPSVEVDGVKYVVPIEEELSLGAWIDLDEAQRAGEAVLSTVLAIVCRPAGEAYDTGNTETRRAMFAALPVSRVFGVLAFFLTCRTAYDKRIAAFSNLARLYGQLPRGIRLLRSLGGGIRLSRTWQVLKYYVLMRLLYFRLRRCLSSFSTSKIRTRPKRRSAS